jgi:hypothetical protein
MRVSAIALAVWVIAAGTACGTNGDGAAEGTSAKPAIESNAQKRAESMVSKLEDFPKGWEASARGENLVSEGKVRKCLGVDYSAFTIIGEAGSKDFTNAATVAQASSSSTVFASEGQADEAIRSFSDSTGSRSAKDCFRDLVQKALNEADTRVETKSKVLKVDVVELSVAPPPDITETSAWRIATVIHDSGELGEITTTDYMDFVTLRQGDSLATVRTDDVSSPVDSELLDALAKALASRMSEASNSS